MGLITILQNPRRLLNSRICPTITPVLGAELLSVNQVSVETDTTGFQVYGNSTIARTTAEAQLGSASLVVTTPGVIPNEGAFTAVVTVLPNTFYRGQLWVKAPVNALLMAEVSDFADKATDINFVGTGEWQNLAVSHVTDTHTNLCIGVKLMTNAQAITYWMDNLSIKILTPSSLIAYLGRRSQRPGTYTCKPTLTVGTRCGIAIGYRDSNNYVLMYHDGTYAMLDKIVGGVATSVIRGFAAYGAGRELKVVVAANGTDYSLYYNGTQIGSTTAIANAGLGIAVYGFNTFAGNEVGLVTASPATS